MKIKIPKFGLKNKWLWLGLAVALVLIHWRFEMNSDEGVILNAAWNLLHGRKLYIDTFEFIAPGGPYLIALWWKTVGASYESARALALALQLSAAYALYLCARELGLRRFVFLPALIFVLASSFWPPINHNAFNLVALAWALYFFLAGLNRGKENIYWILSGFTTALSILFLQHKGGVLFVSLASLLLALSFAKQISFKSFWIFIVSTLLPLSLVFLFWPAQLLYQDLIRFPSLHYHATNIVPLVLWYGSLGISALILALAAAAQHNKRVLVFSLGFLSVCLLLASLPRADGAHILQALVPSYLLLALVFETCLKPHDRFFIILCWLIGMSLVIIKNPPFTASADLILDGINYFCPGAKTFYAGPFLPSVYFETRTLSTTPYSFLITNQQTEAQFSEAAEKLKASPPDCAVLDYDIVNKFSHDQNNPVDKFIKINYRLSGQLGELSFFVKN